MKTERLVQHLTDAARRLGFRVRTEEGNFHGGACVFGSERLLILNRRMPLEERAELLARILARENTEGMFLLPEVRAFVEKFATRTSQGARAAGEVSQVCAHDTESGATDWTR